MAKIAEIQISYRNQNKEPVQIKSSKDAYDLLFELWDEGLIGLQEEFKVLLLNRAHKVLGIYSLSKGGLTGTVVDPRLVFVVALKTGATSIILAHNHPSGNLKPSMQDQSLTKKMVEAGKVLDIQVLDHLIVTQEGYYSFADMGSI